MYHQEQDPGDIGYDDDVIQSSDFDDEPTTICPVCESDDLNIKHYFYDDDFNEPVGRLMECDVCGTMFKAWYPPSPAMT